MQIRKRALAFTILIFVPGIILAVEIKNPCGGDTALLSIVDRPTVGDSACVVPYQQTVIEFGYQYQNLTHSMGHQQNLPEMELRYGMGANNELAVIVSNYIHQSGIPHSGYTASTVGLKHEFGYNQKWLASAEALVTLPSGDAEFGSAKTGIALNGILSYTINSSFNLTLFGGISSETESKADGGRRFTSFNPDLVLTYSASNKMQWYGEVYGQTKTGPDSGSGFNVDGGILYLVKPNISVDLEVGKRISGDLNRFEHYIGTGMAILF